MHKKVEDFSVQLRIDKKLVKQQLACKEKLYDFNFSRPSEGEKRHKILSTLFGRFKNTHIEPPFQCDMGSNIFFGEGGFINYDVKILDIAPVTIGEYVLLAPNVVLSTVNHPIDLAERVKPYACAEPINIGDNVWIGAGSIVLGGVTIGSRSVIGAGSVVTKDIPSDVIAVGNPCRVIKNVVHGQMPSEELLASWWGEFADPE
ncbi:sugar O-acetyltransferase [Psychromonas sp. psych-6C06]|uniref:sugar O-acetyltransferase n=1 Tax=Psychromonas sp. psych-6C06 TaxID=2058089 RepID=UPI000C34488E|nr:sugar O-acetyltransferase [Psychromonas sp. psych-6C06]PKF62176.1 sugar O-acetyltransferase [Psychromonas sp. psych-6C06]